MVICILKKKRYTLRKMALNVQLEFATRKKSFGVKPIAPFERAGKNLSICLLFFLRDTEYDYERVEQSVFCTRNASRAPTGLFLVDASILASKTPKGLKFGRKFLLP